MTSLTSSPPTWTDRSVARFPGVLVDRHEPISHPTLADAISDRLLQDSYHGVREGPAREREGNLGTEDRPGVALLGSRERDLRVHDERKP